MLASRNLRTRLPSVGLLALLLAVPLAGAGIGTVTAVAPHASPAMFHTHSTAQSTNWAGWAISTSNGAVSDVKGSWIVPRIHGTCPASAQYSSFWIGIDGYSSSTVEQIGTDSDCQAGSPTYYAWFEFYPNPSRLISTVTVQPGNSISAEVNYANSTFTVTLKDVNTSKSFSKTSTVKGSRNSAEWIAEAPSSSSGVLPLADFGRVLFGDRTTKVHSTGDATISGTTGTIGSFTGLVQITMINNAGTRTKASPTALTPDGSSFNVTWKAPGP
jgi:hypothetical protein